MNLEKLKTTLKTMGEYLFPVEKVTSYFRSINSKKDLQKFIQQRSAHVTQTTLYGYLKTRIGVKFTAMVEDDVFSKSINIAKWNIYMTAITVLIWKNWGHFFKPDNLVRIIHHFKIIIMVTNANIANSCINRFYLIPVISLGFSGEISFQFNYIIFKPFYSMMGN